MKLYATKFWEDGNTPMQKNLMGVSLLKSKFKKKVINDITIKIF